MRTTDGGATWTALPGAALENYDPNAIAVGPEGKSLYVAYTSEGGSSRIMRSTDSGGSWTDGYSFTPNIDLTVTHVRHFFGSKVSIWTDGGTLLASANVTSVPATWVETPLASPLVLTAGIRYRVGIYSSTTTWYYSSVLTPTFTYGKIDQNYESSGDTFPINVDSVRWLVDLKYTVGSSQSLAVAPADSGAFTNGFWSGSITVQAPATNALLLADL